MDLSILNKQFEKIYVLTIARMQDRHQLLQINLCGLQYNLFFGLDKDEINLNDFEKQGIYNNKKYLAYNKDGNQMRMGVFCCAAGHKSIYEDMVQNNIKSALILEDDAFLIQENIGVLAKIFNQLPKTWELLYLGYEKNENFGIKQKLKSIWYQIFPNHSLLKMKGKQFAKYYAKPLQQNIWKAGFHDCTHAYALTLQAAQKLIAMQTPIVFKSDTLLSYAITLNKIEAYIAKPKIFDQLSILQNSVVTSLVTEKQ